MTVLYRVMKLKIVLTGGVSAPSQKEKKCAGNMSTQPRASNAYCTWFAIIGAPNGTPAWPQGPLSTLLPPGVTRLAFRGAASCIISCMMENAVAEPVNSRPCSD